VPIYTAISISKGTAIISQHLNPSKEPHLWWQASQKRALVEIPLFKLKRSRKDTAPKNRAHASTG
jgi:hypothetical protein